MNTLVTIALQYLINTLFLHPNFVKYKHHKNIIYLYLVFQSVLFCSQ